MTYQWANPIRVGSDAEPPALADRTHTPDPAAVARLKALMAEKDAARHAAADERAAAKQRAADAEKLARALKARSRERRPTPATPATPVKPAQPARSLTDEQVRELHRRWHAGERQTPLAAEAGVDPTTLRRRFARLELPPLPREDERTHAGPLTEAAAVAAHQRYMAGESPLVLSGELGISRISLIRVFHRFDLAVKAVRPPFHPALTSIAVEAAIARAAAGEAWKVIAADLGVCPRALRMARRRMEN